MNKVISFESKRGSKRRKMKKLMFLAIFSLFLFLHTSKMISQA
jgi:hypothetical protein